MATGRAGRVLRKMLTMLGAGLLSIAVCLAVYLGCVLLQPEPGAAPEKTQPVERLQAGDYTDLALLQASFGAGVPYWEQVPLRGETRNGEFENSSVREMDVRYENGMRVRAVTPAAAAPLIREKQAELLVRSDVSCLGVPCALAAREGMYAAYFVRGDTAYCVQMDLTDETGFLAMLESMQIQTGPEE